MNKIKFAVALGACVMAGIVMAGPGRGGHGGHGGPGGRGGPAMRPASMHHAAPRPAPMHHAAPRPAPMHHAAPRPAPVHHGGFRPAPVHHGRFAPPPRMHHPVGARFWARPPCPPPRFGALRTWTWVAMAWNMTINGVYCYGDGYYFDGYNYYYNGAYYTTPPGTTVIVNQPVVVGW